MYHEKDPKLKWFIIDREIPVLYPIELRDDKQEMDFIKKYKDEMNKFNISEPYNKSKSKN